MKTGETHKTILVDRPIGSIVNLDIDGKPYAFRITRKLGCVAMFPGGHGKSEYELTCIKAGPMTAAQILKHEDTAPRIRAGFMGL